MNAFDFYDLTLLPDLETAEVFKIFHGSQSVPAYCTRCKTNWANIASVDVKDETYDICPVCKTDSFLIDAKDGEAFIYTLDGRVINPTTKEQRFNPPIIKFKPSSTSDYDLYREKLDEIQDARNELVSEFNRGQIAAEDYSKKVWHLDDNEEAARGEYKAIVAQYDKEVKSIIIE